MIHFFAKARTLFLLIPSVLFGTNSINAQAVGTDFTQSTTLTALANPWDINFGPDGFLWWTESKNYKLFRSDVYAGTPTKIEVFDFSSSRLFAANNNPFPQGGLMGFAFHPDFANKPYIYVAYVYRFDGCITTNVSCNFRNRIERYTYNASGTPKLTNPVTLIDLPGSSDHNGGRMSVGPDNKLYYCQSDMGAGQFANTFRTHNAQSINVLEGKVLRLNMDPDAGESGGNEWIPNDNPFTDGGNKTAVYTLGHRNHQGIVWANLGGGVNKLYQSEHGPQSDDEFNVIESGRNYGYPYVTGPADGNYNNIDNGPYTCGPTNGNPTEQTHATTYNVKMPLSTLGTTVASPNTNPESSNATWPSVAPAGIDYYGLYPNGPVAGWSNSAIVATLKISSRNPSIQRVSLSTDGNTATNLYNYWTNNVRYRDVAIAPNGRDIFIIQDAASANLYRQRYQNTVASNAGFFATGGGLITYTLNGGSPVNAYNNNANLGFPTSFILNGGIIHTTKTGSGNICSGTLNYRVYKQGTTPGAFTALTGFANDANTTFTTTATPANVTGNTTGQQRWSKSDAAVDVLALATTPGFWVVETYFEATGSVTSSSLCTDGFRLSNGGYNYRYYFGKGPVPNTNTLSPLSAITYGSATPVTLTATISDENPGTGTVTFKIDGNTVGTGTVNAAGVATFSYTPNNLSASGSPHVVTAELVSANYASTIATTNWTVNKAVLTVTAAAKSKTYDGSVFSPFTSTITGYVNGETSSVITGSVTYSGAAITAVNAGNHTITPVISGLSASNYSFSAVNGTLTINKVNLTLTADNKSKTYNNAVFSPFTSTYSGFVNSETASVVTAGTKTFSGSASSAVNAGTYTITPGVTGFTATNYTCTTFINGSLQIDKALLTVTADAKSKTYNGAVFSPFTSTYTGFFGGQTSSVVTGTITYTGTAVSAVNFGTFTITPVVTGLTATNYTFTPANGTLQINKAVLTVTADAKSKFYDGGVFSPFTFTYSGFVNSENSSVVTGTVTYTGAAITAVNAGSHAITPVVTGLSASNYSFTPANGSLVINKVVLSVTANPQNKFYNGAVFSPFTSVITGYVNSENSSVVTGSVTYSGTAASAINSGTYTITPVVTGLTATNYSFSPVNGTLIIDKVLLTATAADKSKTYNGLVFSPFTVTYTGFVNSETSSVVSGTVTYTGAAVSAVNFGTYTITPVVTGLTATNYNFTPANGTLQINKAVLTATADAKSKTYDGSVFSAFTATYTGFVNSENSSVVSGTVTYTGAAITAVNFGTYTITPVVTGLTATNYSFTPANGTLQINKASLTATADAKSKTYDGAVYSSFTTTYTGFVNSENSGVITGTVTYAGSAVAAVNFGTYTITPVVTGLNAANYSFTPANGTLQINKVLLTATADNKSKTYNGAVFSPFTTTYTGFVNSENASVVTGTVTYTGSAVSAINFGTYTITPVVTGISATNYNFTPANGTLQIDKAPLTITADNITVNYQDAVPALTYTVTGYVNSENVSVLSGVPNLTTTYTSATPVASSPVVINIAVGSLSATNYTFNFQDGQITILPLTYYNISGTDLSDVNNWGANTDGSGVHPMNFAVNKYIFNLSNGSNSLNSDITVSGILNMAGGMLFVGNNTLTCNAVTGGSESSFVGTNGTGRLKILNVGSGGLTGNILFPVGIGPYYSPVTLNNSGTSDGFSVNMKINFSGTGFVSHPDSVVNLVWNITEDVPGGSNAALTLGWNTVNEAANFNIAGPHVIGHFTGGEWISTPATTTVGTPNTVSAFGFTSFSPFAVGMAGAFETASLRLRVLLQGAVLGNTAPNVSIMRDNLRNSPFTGSNYIPVSDPYTNLSAYSSIFTRVGDGTSPSLQTILNPTTMFADRSGTNTSAVDWIFIELRDKNNPATVLATRSAIVQQDGTVVDIDGNSCIRFPTQLIDNYYVAVRHRNHLGAMTAVALPVGSFNCSSVIDFTTMTAADLWHNPATPEYDGREMATLSDGKRALWAGNANGDGKVKYVAPTDDPQRIRTNILQFSGNTLLDQAYDFGFGYTPGDVDMNSKTKYVAPSDDRQRVRTLVLSFPLNAFLDQAFDFFVQQLPQ